MIATAKRRIAHTMHALLILLLDGFSWLALAPFLLIGIVAGLLVTLVYWIVAAVLIGYAVGRNHHA